MLTVRHDNSAPDGVAAAAAAAVLLLLFVFHQHHGTLLHYTPAQLKPISHSTITP
jgi:membrane-associated phospholipid phosphatase